MQKITNLLFSGLALLAGLWIATRPVQALPDYSEKEKKECAFCHPGGDASKLTDAGKYYKDNKHSLKGFRPKK